MPQQDVKSIIRKLKSQNVPDDRIKEYLTSKGLVNVEKPKELETKDAAVVQEGGASKSEGASSESQKEEISAQAKAIVLQNSVPGVPPVVVDKAAALISGTLDMFANITKVPRQATYGIISSAYELFDPESVDTPEEKEMLMKSIEFASRFNAGSGFEKLGDKAEEVADITADATTKHDKTIGEQVLSGDVLGAVDQTVQQIAFTAPSVAAAFTGAGGVGLLGASAFGGKFEEEYEKDPTQAGSKLFMVASATAGVEIVSEAVTAGIAGRAKALLAGKGPAAAKKYLAGMFESVAAQANVEGWSEVAATVGNKYIDQIAYGRDIDLGELMRESVDSYILGSVIGGGIATVGQSGKSNTEKAIIAEKVAPDAVKEERAADAKKMNDISKVDNPVIQNLNDQIKTKMEDSTTEVRDVVDNMPQEEVAETLQNQKDIQEAGKVLEDPEVPDSAKEAIEEEVKVKKERNQQIYDNAKSNTINTTESINTINQWNQTDTSNLTPEQVEEGDVEVQQAETKTRNKLRFESETNEEVSESTKKEIQRGNVVLKYNADGSYEYDIISGTAIGSTPEGKSVVVRGKKVGTQRVRATEVPTKESAERSLDLQRAETISRLKKFQNIGALKGLDNVRIADNGIDVYATDPKTGLDIKLDIKDYISPTAIPGNYEELAQQEARENLLKTTGYFENVEGVKAKEINKVIQDSFNSVTDQVANTDTPGLKNALGLYDRISKLLKVSANFKDKLNVNTPSVQHKALSAAYAPFKAVKTANDAVKSIDAKIAIEKAKTATVNEQGQSTGGPDPAKIEDLELQRDDAIADIEAAVAALPEAFEIPEVNLENINTDASALPIQETKRKKAINKLLSKLDKKADAKQIARLRKELNELSVKDINLLSKYNRDIAKQAKGDLTEADTKKYLSGKLSPGDIAVKANRAIQAASRRFYGSVSLDAIQQANLGVIEHLSKPATKKRIKEGGRATLIGEVFNGVENALIHFKHQNKIVPVPENVRRDLNRLRPVREALLQETGNNPSYDEIADAINKGIEVVQYGTVPGTVERGLGRSGEVSVFVPKEGKKDDAYKVTRKATVKTIKARKGEVVTAEQLERAESSVFINNALNDPTTIATSEGEIDLLDQIVDVKQAQVDNRSLSQVLFSPTEIQEIDAAIKRGTLDADTVIDDYVKKLKPTDIAKKLERAGARGNIIEDIVLPKNKSFKARTAINNVKDVLKIEVYSRLNDAQIEQGYRSQTTRRGAHPDTEFNLEDFLEELDQAETLRFAGLSEFSIEKAELKRRSRKEAIEYGANRDDLTSFNIDEGIERNPDGSLVRQKQIDNYIKDIHDNPGYDADYYRDNYADDSLTAEEAEFAEDQALDTSLNIDESIPEFKQHNDLSKAKGKPIQLNIGLENNPIDNIDGIINELKKNPKVTLGSTEQVNGEYLGEVERTVVVDAKYDGTPAQFKKYIQELSAGLTQEAIGTTFDGKGDLVYDPKFKGERYTFDPQFFVNPSKKLTNLSVEDGNKKYSKSVTTGDPFIQAISSTLQKNWPDINLLMSNKRWNNFTSQLAIPIPPTVRGLQHGATIALNPNRVGYDTPIHEFSHIWLRGLQQTNPKLWLAGQKLLKGSEYAKIVYDNPMYRQYLKDGETARFWEEVMANAVGKRGAELFTQQKDVSKWDKFISKLGDWVKQKLNISSAKDYQDLTLEDWLDYAVHGTLTNASIPKPSPDPAFNLEEGARSEKKRKYVEQLLNKPQVYKDNSPYKKSKVPQETREFLNGLKKTFADKASGFTESQLDELTSLIEQRIDAGRQDQLDKRANIKQGRVQQAQDAADIIKGIANQDPATLNHNDIDALAKENTKFLNRLKTRGIGGIIADALSPSSNDDFYGLTGRLLIGSKGNRAANEAKVANYLYEPLERGNRDYLENKYKIKNSYDNLVKILGKGDVDKGKKLLKNSSNIKVGESTLSNSQVVMVYNYLKDPRLYKQLSKGGVNNDIANQIIDYVNKNDKLKSFAYNIPSIYSEFVNKLNAKLDQHGYRGVGKTTIDQSKLDADQLEILKKVYDGKIGEIAPYTPVFARGEETLELTEDLFEGGKGKDFYTVMSGRLKQRNYQGAIKFAGVDLDTQLQSYVGNGGPVRTEAFLDFAKNSSAFFTSDNLKALNASLGNSWTSSIKDSLKRIVTGSNRGTASPESVSKLDKWINRSIGNILFLNPRSAVLQLLSMGNFAIDNPKAYTKYVGTAKARQARSLIMNSPFMKNRKETGQTDVVTQELLTQKGDNFFEQGVDKLSEFGYGLTRFADGLAIGVGGSPYLASKIEEYGGDFNNPNDPGTRRAMRDFLVKANEAQQSTNPEKLGRDQTHPVGRYLLAFTNATQQFNRIMATSAREISAGKNVGANAAKISYYMGFQIALFSGLQKAIGTALDFSDEEDEEKIADWIFNIVDTMVSSAGIIGAVYATTIQAAKQYLRNLDDEGNLKRGADQKILNEFINISPAIGTKLRNIKNAINDPYKQSAGPIDIDARVAKVASAIQVSGIPAERVLKLFEQMNDLGANDLYILEKAFRVLGWSRYDLGVPLGKNEVEDSRRPSRERPRTLQTRRREERAKQRQR